MTSRRIIQEVQGSISDKDKALLEATHDNFIAQLLDEVRST